MICEMEPLIPPTATQVLRQGELQCHARPARADRLRRRAPLHPDHAREVRHHHLRSDPSVGEGQRHAVLEGVLRPGEAASQSRRRRDAVGAALRERPARRSRASSPRSSTCSPTARFGATRTAAGTIPVVLGQNEPPRIDLDALERGWRAPITRASCSRCRSSGSAR